MPAVSAADLELLRQYDTPTICNVVELFDLVPAHRRLHGRPHPGAATRSCRRWSATPARRRSARPRRRGRQRLRRPGPSRWRRSPSCPARPVVVFQDLDSPPAAATFGEVMCTTYKAFGAVGLITSGAGRDLDQVEALDFPCFTGGTICAHGYCHIPCDQRAGPRRRRDDPPRRPAARRPQRRDDDPARDRLARWPRRAPSWHGGRGGRAGLPARRASVTSKGYAEAREECKRPHRRPGAAAAALVKSRPV